MTGLERKMIEDFLEAANRWVKGTPIQWCEEHKSGINWHTGTNPEGEKCDAYRLLAYPGQTTDHIPKCQIAEWKLC